MLRMTTAVLWPSFMVAIVAEGFFFSLFDPHHLLIAGSLMEVSPLAAYTVGFFCFWGFCGLASMLTYWLVKAPGGRKPP
jgi:H+/Cl- antiporter ClcA